MNVYEAGPSGSSRPYQGYPYVDPAVHNVASIENATYARWTSPRQPGALYEQPATSNRATPSGSPINPTTQEVSRPQENRPDVPPSSEVKIDYDTNPVVYIDLPESSGSDVAEQRRPPAEEPYLQQTIFFDQFKNQTVVTVANETQGSSTSSTSSGNPFVRPNRPTRPAPPVTLSLGSPSTGYPSSNSRSTPGAPPLMSTEASLYEAFSGGDNTRLPEVREFPCPPPAYSEYDTLSTPGSPPPVTRQPPRQQPVTRQPPRQQPPQVITPPSPQTPQIPQTPMSPVLLTPTNLPRTQVITLTLDMQDKMVFCKYCRSNKPSFVMKEVGFATHMFGLCMLFMGMLPCICLLYCSKSCRYKNHYCKQCSRLMAYEIPCCCSRMTYVD